MGEQVCSLTGNDSCQHLCLDYILAISFERYYAICRPLKANYICTKSRAAMICLAAWVLATIITSPMIFMIAYVEGENECGEWSARCYVTAGKTWPDAYTISTIFLFFLLPFFILLVTYGMIAKRLTTDRSALNAKNENHKARKQVVLMLGTVVFAFFLCLLPFRVLTLFVLLADTKFLEEHAEAYQNFIYFSRMMIYVNSSLNPILYNIMSSKFRNGFLRLCNRRRKQSPFTRTGTFITNTTTNSTTMSINLGHQPAGNGNCSGVASYGKCNGHSTGHNSLGHCSSLKKNVSPSSRPDLLKTLIRSQSNGSTAGSTNVSASMCNSQCIHYYNNHTCGNGIRHIGTNGFNNCIPLTTSTSGRGPTSTMRPQSHPNFTANGTNGVGVKGPTNMYNNTDCMNGKHMTVKSDSVYTAYLPGKRSETVL
ncbi:Growth hormone secretagogue receptor type 1 [Orchesella cincta]|uniref:Growth hormone secretagogue receptor type 1 n=1 Tax=Orchesella cincta TaxID=48709 RepID=A0A1D2MAS4_ORCCI|nr:Growth hormone secretagogue receptor type 1 [Orchesella cincta]